MELQTKGDRASSESEGVHSVFLIVNVANVVHILPLLKVNKDFFLIFKEQEYLSIHSLMDPKCLKQCPELTGNTYNKALGIIIC